jgi:putative aldouronate transport system substrate-binding protein
VEKELVTLQVFSMNSNTSGLMTNTYWADILKRDLNIQIELLPAGDDAASKLAALMASGSLPDLVVFKDNTTYVSDAITANMLIDLDEHLDVLPNVVANAPMALQYMRDQVSNGTGKAYSVPTQATNQPSKLGSVIGPYLRWDLYKELGSPKLTDIEDYLPVLEQMLELEPNNPDGQKNYGMAIFDDWDGNVSWPVRLITEMYGVTQDGYGFSEVNNNTGTISSIYNDDSYFKRAIKFYYTANQMGLMDPDLITDTFDDYDAKASAGRSMFQLLSWTSWNYETDATRESGRSYRGVFFDNERMMIASPPYVGGAGGNSWFAISSASKYPDRALEFLDYLYSYDGLWNLAWGDQGIAWDLNAAGQPYRTAKGWQMNGERIPFDNGGQISEGLNILNAFGMPWTVIHPTYGKRMDELDWDRGEGAPPLSNVEVDWQNITGAIDDLDYAFKNGLYVVRPFVPPLPPFPEDLQAIVDQVSSANHTATYRLMVAKNDADFDAQWAELVETARGMGAEQVNEWVKEAYEKSAAEGAKYQY